MKGKGGFQFIQSVLQRLLEVFAAADDIFLIIQIQADCLADEDGFPSITRFPAYLFLSAFQMNNSVIAVDDRLNQYALDMIGILPDGEVAQLIMP